LRAYLQILLFVTIAFSACKQNTTNTQEEHDSSLDYLEEEFGDYFKNKNDTADSLNLIPDDFSTKFASYTFHNIDRNLFYTYFNTSHKEEINSEIPESLEVIDSCFVVYMTQRIDTLCDNLKDDFSDEYIDYSYKGHWDSLNFLIFETAIYEELIYFIYDLDKGKKVYLWNQPILSPDKEMILSYSYDLIAGFQPNGIQMFRITDQGLVKEFELEFFNWGPDSCYWLNNNEFILKRNIIDFETYNIEKEEYTLIKLTKLAS
jgi:hypothetical protein